MDKQSDVVGSGEQTCTDLATEKLIAAAIEARAEIHRLRDAMFRTYCVTANGGNRAEIIQAIEAERTAYEVASAIPRLDAALATLGSAK